MKQWKVVKRPDITGNIHWPWTLENLNGKFAADFDDGDGVGGWDWRPRRYRTMEEAAADAVRLNK